jgi:hypothetical protein
VWDISHEDKIYRCVYDKSRKQIVTLLSVIPNGATPLPEQKEVSPKKEEIFKYGVIWKSEEKLKKHEETMKKRYESDYEKWATQFKPVEDVLS